MMRKLQVCAMVVFNSLPLVFGFSISAPKKLNTDGWVNLIEHNPEAPVRKWVLEKGCGAVPSRGSLVEIYYVGSFGPGPEFLSVEDVVECWLKPQQGLYDLLKDVFRQNEVNGKMLCRTDVFTEEFVSNFGLTKLQSKKLVNAAKRLASQNVDLNFQDGEVFDSSSSRNKAFKFILGAGKAIKAMDLLVSSMEIGEKARVQARSDFCYGEEGFRTKAGEVLVPPFATLCFDVTLLSSE